MFILLLQADSYCIDWSYDHHDYKTTLKKFLKFQDENRKKRAELWEKEASRLCVY